MQKSKKKLLGLLGLGFVAAMTAFAYLLPANNAYAEGASDSHTDTIRVTVYDRYPAIKFTAPEDGHIQTSPLFKFNFDYENSSYVNVTLIYDATDEGTGEVVQKELPLKQFVPDELDPTFNYASGSQEYDINLATCKIGIDEDVFNIPGCVATRSGGLMLGAFIPPADDDKLVYNKYILHVESYSPVGYDEDFIEFYYVPAILTQTGSADTTQDPVVNIEYDEGVAKVEVMPVDGNGNPLFDKPIVITLEPDETGKFPAGSQTVTLPFGSYGLNTGEYSVVVTSYKQTSEAATDDDGNPIYDEDGNPVYNYGYEVLPAPIDTFTVSYTQPAAPDVPNTGRLLGNLNLASSDIIVTSVIAFAGCAAVAFIFISRRKKDYRKNVRGRK